MNNESRITDIVDFNPPRKLKKGQIAPFIDMAALPTNERDIVEITEKAFTGGAKFRNGDTLFARITPCLENGKTGKVSNLSDEVIGHGSTEFIVMTAKDSEIDEDYVYYLARLPEFRKFAQMRMTGTSGRQRVSWQDLAEFTFAFPEPEKRKAAGVFLKTIDDKIQLNTQTNQTLEQIAQAIYKSWFVDYEPTRAKATVLAAGGNEEEAETAAMTAISGKNAADLAALKQDQPTRYQQLADLAAAFPAALVPADDFGEIPEGWEAATLGEICDMKNGYAFKSADWTESGIPVIKIGSVKPMLVEVEGNGFVDANFATSKPEFLVQPGDILVGLTGYVGEVGRMPHGRNAMLNQRVAKFVPKKIDSAHTYYNFVYCLARQDTFKRFAEGNAKGSAQANISTKELLKYPTVIADSTIHKAFESFTAALMEKILLHSSISWQLAKARDLLLPKLLNGEI